MKLTVKDKNLVIELIEIDLQLLKFIRGFKNIKSSREVDLEDLLKKLKGEK